MLRSYIKKKFNSAQMEIIIAANAIIKEYDAAGFSLTLRQLYYQFVSRDLFANDDKNYDRLGSIISDARMAGMVSWEAIEDRTRYLRGYTTYDGPAHAIKEAKIKFKIDKWARQPWRPEVWVEKDALVGVIAGICNDLGVNFFACRGYNSQSEQWRAGRRFAGYIDKGQRPIIFHLGDHDPSGIDMTRDNRDRLSLFAGVPLMVSRLALNMPQVEEYNPPPNPAKLSDSRAADYVAKYGDSSWELDALPPTVIASLIREAVLKIRDENLWSEALAEEAMHIETLDLVIEGME